jgi:beta-phosphoglucomutase-like phosphatase (HAD superfamily)
MFLPHMLAAVIFDIDGLIFDAETLNQEAFLVATTAVGTAFAPLRHPA